MGRKLAVISLAFLLVRSLTAFAYRDTLYYYGMITHQYAIAEAAWSGHGFAHDPVLSGGALSEAKRQGRHIPLEEWSRLPRSGRYVTFPAADLPGLGYLIAWTSRLLGGELTTRYALALQVLVELLSVLAFTLCAARALGSRVALGSALVYVLAYPFIWPIASLPMRDVFILGTYASWIAAVFLFLYRPQPRVWPAIAALLTLGSLLLWVRPHGYYFFLVLLPLVLGSRQRSLRARAALALALVLVPWLSFGRPLRQFNLRHYGVAETDALGRTLWQHMGIAQPNPYGFTLPDEGMLPFIRSRHGKEVEYASPEMNRLLGDYARRVMREDPLYYLKTVALACLEMLKTPVDFVPPFPLVEYGSSGLTPAEYAGAHPFAFAFKAFNRVFLAVFFYGGVFLTVRLARRLPRARLPLAVLMSPLAYATLVQAATHFESRYMATAAWVLVLPWGWALASVSRFGPWRTSSAAS
jgi:hypothetical protein